MVRRNLTSLRLPIPRNRHAQDLVKVLRNANSDLEKHLRRTSRAINQTQEASTFQCYNTDATSVVANADTDVTFTATGNTVAIDVFIKSNQTAFNALLGGTFTVELERVDTGTTSLISVTQGLNGLVNVPYMDTPANGPVTYRVSSTIDSDRVIIRVLEGVINAET